MAIGSTRADAPPFLDLAPLIGSTALAASPPKHWVARELAPTGCAHRRARELSRNAARASFCAINLYSPAPPLQTSVSRDEQQPNPH